MHKRWLGCVAFISGCLSEDIGVPPVRPLESSITLPTYTAGLNGRLFNVRCEGLE